jgi:hypothetical protein
MKYSLHRLIPFLPLFCNCQFLSSQVHISAVGVSKLDLVQILCPQALIPAGWRLETTEFYAAIARFGTLLYNHFARRKHNPSLVEKACLQCRCIATEVTRVLLAYSLRRNVFTDPLPSNERLLWLHYSGFLASCLNIFLLPGIEPRTSSAQPVAVPTVLSRVISLSL